MYFNFKRKKTTTTKQSTYTVYWRLDLIWLSCITHFFSCQITCSCKSSLFLTDLELVKLQLRVQILVSSNLLLKRPWIPIHGSAHRPMLLHPHFRLTKKENQLLQHLNNSNNKTNRTVIKLLRAQWQQNRPTQIRNHGEESRSILLCFSISTHIDQHDYVLHIEFFNWLCLWLFLLFFADVKKTVLIYTKKYFISRFILWCKRNKKKRTRHVTNVLL